MCGKKLIMIGMMLIAILSSCGDRKELAPCLVEPGCEPPCWQQIIPGKSTFEDIKGQVPEIKGIDGDSIFIDEREILYDACVRWDFIEDGQVGEVCVFNQTASFIALVGDFGLTLEKAISIYGEPDQFVYSRQAVGDPVALRVVLFYLEKGLVISFKQSDLDTITLEPENKIDYILFYDLALYPEIIIRLIVEEKDLEEHKMEWLGYVDIPIRN